MTDDENNNNNDEIAKSEEDYNDLKIIEEALEEGEVPAFEANQFRHLYTLTLNLSTQYGAEALRYHEQREGAKTSAKRDLYNRKFKKARAKWLDEVNRLKNLESIMVENNIPLTPPDDDFKIDDHEFEIDENDFQIVNGESK